MRLWHKENFSKFFRFLNVFSDDYKPDRDDDDDDESCSSGVDENELEEDSPSEEDIDDIAEMVVECLILTLPHKWLLQQITVTSQ